MKKITLFSLSCISLMITMGGCTPTKSFFSRSVLDYSQIDNQYDFKIIPKNRGYVIDPFKAIPCGEVSISINEGHLYSLKAVNSIEKELREKIVKKTERGWNVIASFDVAMEYFIKEAKKLGANGVIDFDVIPRGELGASQGLTLEGTAVKFKE